eukprot:EG_transcript_15829
MAPKKAFPLFAAEKRKTPDTDRATEADGEAPPAKAAKTAAKAGAKAAAKSAAKAKPAKPSAPATSSSAPASPEGAGTLQKELTASIVDPKWQAVLAKQLQSTTFQKICQKLEQDTAAGETIFPPRDRIFAAFNYAKWDDLKVVIIGQDPYHDDGQAHGLCFSVNVGVAVPPSLKNMYTELESDIPGYKRPSHGNLEAWAAQGVLLLNASLTVIAHKANSHSGIGWQEFTDNVIKVISEQHSGLVFLLWGGFAQKKGKLVDKKKHRVLEAAHPSPLSANKWKGCKAFSKCNAALKELGKAPINWQN